MEASPHNDNHSDAADRAGVPPEKIAATKTSASLNSNRRTGWQRFNLFLKVVEVRLRFVAVLIVVAVFLGYWDTIANHWEKQTRSDGAVYHAVHSVLGGRAAHWLWPQAGTAPAASNSEYYCPMHPNVVRETFDPEGGIPKCPICGMPLSLRVKGEAPTLPEGVLSRKQYSPEQIQAAGISTVEAAYRPLEKQITAVGYVTYDESRRSQIVVRVAGYIEKLYVDKPWIAVRQGEPLGELYSPELYSAAQELLIATERAASIELAKNTREKLRLLGVGDREIDEIIKSRKAVPRLVLRSPFSGHLIQKNVEVGGHVEAGQTLFEVADLSRVWIEAEVYEADIEFLRKGQVIEAAVEAFPNHVFSAKVSLVHPHMNSSTRTNAVRFEVDNPAHQLRPGMFATVRIKTPLSQIEPFARLQPAGRPGEVLAVPERSVIDTGEKKIVYVEHQPGLFEGVEVELGPRVDDFYPVIKGVTRGERIAERGAFLVDAETRLNPAVAAAYIGAGGSSQPETRSPAATAVRLPDSAQTEPSRPLQEPPPADDKQPSAEDRRSIAKLSPADRDVAMVQRVCPVSGESLGSMGVPYKLTLKNRTVFLCCPGCVAEAQKNPDKILKRLAGRKKAADGKQPISPPAERHP